MYFLSQFRVTSSILWTEAAMSLESVKRRKAQSLQRQNCRLASPPTVARSFRRAKTHYLVFDAPSRTMTLIIYYLSRIKASSIKFYFNRFQWCMHCRFNLVYAIFYLLGVCSLLPWSFFVNAKQVSGCISIDSVRLSMRWSYIWVESSCLKWAKWSVSINIMAQSLNY